ncbi:MAG: HU family DNA-binding protein, partial [Bacteroidota bacterium]
MNDTLIQQLADQFELTPDQAQEALDGFLNAFHGQLEAHGEASLNGLGTFTASPDGLTFAPDELAAFAVNGRFAGLDVMTLDEPLDALVPEIADPVEDTEQPLSAAVPPTLVSDEPPADAAPSPTTTEDEAPEPDDEPLLADASAVEDLSADEPQDADAETSPVIDLQAVLGAMATEPGEETPTVPVSDEAPASEAEADEDPDGFDSFFDEWTQDDFDATRTTSTADSDALLGAAPLGLASSADDLVPSFRQALDEADDEPEAPRATETADTAAHAESHEDDAQDAPAEEVAAHAPLPETGHAETPDASTPDVHDTVADFDGAEETQPDAVQPSDLAETAEDHEYAAADAPAEEMEEASTAALLPTEDAEDEPTDEADTEDTIDLSALDTAEKDPAGTEDEPTEEAGTEETFDLSALDAFDEETTATAATEAEDTFDLSAFDALTEEPSTEDETVDEADTDETFDLSALDAFDEAAAATAEADTEEEPIDEADTEETFDLSAFGALTEEADTEEELVDGPDAANTFDLSAFDALTEEPSTEGEPVDESETEETFD